MYYGTGSIYDPSTYPKGVPNPYGPRVHAWGEGPWPSEGTRYHGPVYTRPMWSQDGSEWMERPFAGLGAVNNDAVAQATAIGFLGIGAVILFGALLITSR